MNRAFTKQMRNLKKIYIIYTRKCKSTQKMHGFTILTGNLQKWFVNLGTFFITSLKTCHPCMYTHIWHKNYQLPTYTKMHISITLKTSCWKPNFEFGPIVLDQYNTSGLTTVNKDEICRGFGIKSGSNFANSVHRPGAVV